MFPRLGGMEWIIILIVVILVFGPGRIGKVAGEIGKSIKSFRDGLGSKEDEKDETAEQSSEPQDKK